LTEHYTLSGFDAVT